MQSLAHVNILAVLAKATTPPQTIGNFVIAVTVVRVTRAKSVLDKDLKDLVAGER